MKTFVCILIFIIFVSTVNCLVCERYFSGIPLTKKSKIHKTNVTCSGENAYCVNATTTLIKWTLTARTCSDDTSVIQKIFPDFLGCSNSTCTTRGNLLLSNSGTVCCCTNDLCNGSHKSFNFFSFLCLLSVIKLIVYFLH